MVGVGQIGAQVTIGANTKPLDGALLDLKQDNMEGEVTATRGLGLPRVQLTAKKYLYPMFSKSDSDYSTPDEQKIQHDLHVGLMVYVPEVFELVHCPGLYVWDGVEWIPLEDRSPKNELSFTDGEGNTYTYRQYGNMYWMTQNVRSVTKQALGVTPITKIGAGTEKYSPIANLLKVQGSPLNPNFVEVPSLASLQTMPEISYIANGLPMTESFSEYLKKFGLLYSYQQAAEACPEGWQLPSETDWKNLEKEVGQMIGVGPVTGNYEVFKILKYPAASFGAIGSSEAPSPWGGYNICMDTDKEVGFNVIPAGAFHKDGNVWMFSYGGYFWTSTLKVNDNSQGIRVGLRDEREFQDLRLNYGYYPKTMGYSLRCVKPVN